MSEDIEKKVEERLKDALKAAADGAERERLAKQALNDMVRYTQAKKFLVVIERENSSIAIAHSGTMTDLLGLAKFAERDGICQALDAFGGSGRFPRLFPAPPPPPKKKKKSSTGE
jgi:hypothetical protein